MSKHLNLPGKEKDMSEKFHFKIVRL